MKDEIKEILDNIRKIIKSNRENDFNRIIYDCDSIEKLLDYITNLQTIEQQYGAILSENAELENKITNLQKENENYRKIIKRVLRKLNATVNHFKSKQKNNCIEHSISILSGDE